MYSSILDEADNLINGQRAEDYGDAQENFKRIADMWSAYLGEPDFFSGVDVARMMILLKISRLASGTFHRDALVDIAGYAALEEKLHDLPMVWVET